MAYPPVKQPVIKHVDKYGNFVDAANEAAAFQVNMDDPNTPNFIDRLKGEKVDTGPVSVGVGHPTTVVVDLGTTAAPLLPKPKK